MIHFDQCRLRYLLPTLPLLVFWLSSCRPTGGELALGTRMHRPEDGKTVWCLTGTFAVPGGEANARRIMNACVLACRKHGFIEDGPPLDIDERSSKLKPEEGSGNTPAICAG